MKYEASALQAIKDSSGTEIGEDGVDLFVSHHLEELPTSYWVELLGTESPSSEQVIGLLVLRSKWEGEEVYDFTLPGEVTDYVVSVTFNEEGKVESIEMES
ncbi:DUF2004 domain-containing protein [Grimontia sp. NTOU-MAR1]|uniref:DUF2004 domain-containing protein n=1 Tax=Grimontia sp. NTOU-MAR1 TaxID=3111011 RepID=UPI002DB95DE5|nr:DUF2004 domain-containing protein [Grimontia sp. NTOU-MAR1]WRV97965.1 DUF2004 domain-containing protein [Grimontia sp. NTOU-MAR1]